MASKYLVSVSSHRRPKSLLPPTEKTKRSSQACCIGDRVPRQLPGVKIDGKRFVTVTKFSNSKRRPNLLVLGAEQSAWSRLIYQRFGTVVEMLDRVLPLEDDDVSAEMAKCYKKRGIKIMTGTKFEGAVVDGDEVVATLHDGKRKSEIASVPVAIGRAPVTEVLILTPLGLNQRTWSSASQRVYANQYPHGHAIGDIVPTPQLAHTASAEAMPRLTTLQVKAPRLSITSSTQLYVQ